MMLLKDTELFQDKCNLIHLICCASLQITVSSVILITWEQKSLKQDCIALKGPNSTRALLFFLHSRRKEKGLGENNKTKLPFPVFYKQAQEMRKTGCSSRSHQSRLFLKYSMNHSIQSRIISGEITCQPSVQRDLWLITSRKIKSWPGFRCLQAPSLRYQVAEKGEDRASAASLWAP